MAYPSLMNKKLLFSVLKHSKLWLFISALFLIPSILAIIYSCIVNPNHAPLKLGIDFTGGTVLQYSVEQKLDIKDVQNVREKLVAQGVHNPLVQSIEGPSGDIISIKMPFIEQEDGETSLKVDSALAEALKNPELIQTNSVGPTLGAELLKNSLSAVVLAFLGIVVYISFRFQYEYAAVTLLTIVHNLIILIGVFSIFSILFNMYMDSLFITAVLTSIGYSVHDTIVVFDRIRENNRFLAKKYSFAQIVDASVSQTFARSMNTSFTLVLVLLALYFFGGTTTKDFVLAMLLGVIVGTYSSIFFGSVVLNYVMTKRQPKVVEAEA
ncbi:preprotein translocase subunit SecF [Candidatus Gastranaerophilus sp. (ex Termes propinquus)]|nr:preprotein translocase subunit SecF [Candidatus Gastranaerophilus sp. (ex Termes propinquus)]